jgi:hypothetical protein
MSDRTLSWRSASARSFGFVDFSRERSYPCNYSERKITFSGFAPLFKNLAITADAPKVTHYNLVQGFFLDYLWEHATQGVISFSDNKEVMDFGKDPKTAPIRRWFDDMLEDIDARELLRPAGRLWLGLGVISFWVFDHKLVTKEHLERVFAEYKIPASEYEQYIIEFLGEEKSTTTVKQFLAGEVTTADPTKEQQKRAADALAKVHLAAAQGTKDVDVQNIISQRKGALQQQDARLRTQGKIPSIQTRQKITTSESSFPSFRDYLS